jgi:hypothetical protein
MGNQRLVEFKEAISKNACPLPRIAKTPSRFIPINALKYRSHIIHRTSFFWILTAIVGTAIFLLIWIFPPHTVFVHQEIYTQNGYLITDFSYIISILWSWGPLPLYIAIILGLLSGSFIRLYDENTGRKRLFTGVIFGYIISFAYFMDITLADSRPSLYVTQIIHYQMGIRASYEISFPPAVFASISIVYQLLFLIGILLVFVPGFALITGIASFPGDWLYTFFSGKGRWGAAYPGGYGETIPLRKTGYLSSYAHHMKRRERTDEPRDNLSRELLWIRDRYWA